jgi:hypothetical protein
VRIDEEQVSGVFFSVTDVTERKHAEEQLRYGCSAKVWEEKS